MSSQLFADAGPPPEMVYGFLICAGIAGVLLVAGIVLFGLWLARRTRKQEADPRENE